MSRLLLCPPDHYAVRYEINPWMDRTVRVDHALAVRQWQGLHDLLIRLGCEVELVRPHPAWPDMVFTANAGLVVASQFMRANFRHAERSGEVPLFERWFAEHGYHGSRMPEPIAFEGEGDTLFCGNVLFCGHPFRTDKHAHSLLGEWLKRKVVSLKLADPRYYHLDTCFCPMDANIAAWFPAAFDDQSQQIVHDSISDLIEVSPEEALRFGCNAVVMDREVILPEGCPQLCADLKSRGLHPHSLPMTEFIKAGGACKCLVLRLA
jgi:N-dimethylarginine dimethylaminohydrolase